MANGVNSSAQSAYNMGLGASEWARQFAGGTGVSPMNTDGSNIFSNYLLQMPNYFQTTGDASLDMRNRLIDLYAPQVSGLMNTLAQQGAGAYRAGQGIANAGAANYKRTLPLENTLIDQMIGFAQGGAIPDALSPVYSAGKLQAERSAAQSMEELMASTPNGGAQTAGLLDIINNKANTLTGLKGNIAQNMYEKAYNYGTNALPQYSAAATAGGNLMSSGAAATGQALGGFDNIANLFNSANSATGNATDAYQGNTQALTNAGTLSNANSGQAINNNLSLLQSILGYGSNAMGARTSLGTGQTGNGLLPAAMGVFGQGAGAFLGSDAGSTLLASLFL